MLRYNSVLNRSLPGGPGPYLSCWLWFPGGSVQLSVKNKGVSEGVAVVAFMLCYNYEELYMKCSSVMVMKFSFFCFFFHGHNQFAQPKEEPKVEPAAEEKSAPGFDFRKLFEVVRFFFSFFSRCV